MAELDAADDELLGRLKQGDEEAFLVIYHRWQGPLYRYALRMSGAPSTAEDVVQEVFVVLIQGVQTYDPARGSLGAYLYGVARNQVRRRLDRDRSLARRGLECGPEPATDEDVLGELSRRETVDRVRTAVLSLPPHYREPIVLCDLQGLSYEQAAEVLGCVVGTVRSRLHRGRDLVLAKLTRSDGAEAAPHPARMAEGTS